jgi:hypothetical protein
MIGHPFLRVASTFLLLACVTTASAADILFDNLDQNDYPSQINDVSIATNSSWYGQQFKTDGQGYTLVDVTLYMMRGSGTGAAIVEIFSDNGTINPAPSSWLHTLTSPGSYSGTRANTTFTSTGFNLAANTSYWVVLRSADTSAFFWSWTNVTTGLGVGFSPNWAESTNSGATWPAISDGSPQNMQVRAQPVPEPSSMILAALGCSAAWLRRINGIG